MFLDILEDIFSWLVGVASQVMILLVAVVFCAAFVLIYTTYAVFHPRELTTLGKELTKIIKGK